MSVFSERLDRVLAERRAAGLYRQRLTLDSAQGTRVRVDGRQLLNFCSNDYLGLAAHPDIIDGLAQGAARYGVGSGASHLVCGHSRPHHALEEALADFTGRPRALLFSTGFAANTGTLKALLQGGDTVLEDRLNHASLIDGGLTSGARFKRFAHNDLDDLDHKLRGAAGTPCLVAVDGVYSMDGDAAPLAAMADVTGPAGAWLMVDDAHGFGLLGARGAGSVAAAGLGVEEVPILMATLGKALGTAGAFVAGKEALIETLLQTARNYIYSTAMPPALAAASLTALRVLQREGAERRERLASLVQRFRRGAGQLGLNLVTGANGPIQPWIVGEAEAATALSLALRERGLLVGAIRPPTVPAGTSRLRVTLTAAHSEADVDELLACLDACWKPDGR